MAKNLLSHGSLLTALALLIIGRTACLAQHNVAYHIHNDQVLNIVELNGHFYVHTDVSSPASSQRSYLNRISENGTMQFSKAISRQGMTQGEDMIATSDGKLLLAGTDHHCDYGFDGKFVLKLDTNGMILFDQKFTGKAMEKMMLVEVSDSSFYVLQQNDIVHFSKGGVIDNWYQDPGIDSINSAAALPNGDLLVSGKYQGLKQLVELDQSGSVVSSMVAQEAGKLMCSAGGQVYHVHKSGIIKYNAMMGVLASSTINVMDAALRADTLYTIGAGNQYRVLDSSLNLIHSFVYTGAGVSNCIAVGANKVILDSDRTPVAWGLGHNSGVTVFPKMQGYTHPDDIGVSSWTLNPSSTVFVEPIYNGAVTRLDLDLEFDVEVKNFGTTTVNTCYLNIPMAPMSGAMEYCFRSYYHTKFTGLGLAPGASKVVNTGRVKVYWFGQVGGTTADTVMTIWNVSISASAPNERLDGNGVNNAHTANIDVDVVGLDEISNDAAAVSLFPNPVSDHITIKGAHLIKKVEVYDAVGLLMRTMTTNDAVFSIDLRGLNEGVYLLQLSSPDRKITRKVVKQ